MGDLAVADASPAPIGTAPGDAANPSDEPARRFATRYFWLWPGLLTLAAGLWKVRVPGLWADELATWGAVRTTWRGLFELLGNVDAVLGPYLVAMKAWTTLAGTSTLALRLPSVLAMAGAASLVALLGFRLGRRSEWVGLLAGLAFAVVPTVSRYGQEARPYAFLMLFAVLATLLLTALRERPGPATALPYAPAVALLGASHLTGLLLLVAHAVAVPRRALRWWVPAAGAGLLPVLPLSWLGHRQSGQIAWIPAEHGRTLLATPDTLFGSGMVAGALIALSLLAFGRNPAVRLLAAWALVPVAALYLIGLYVSLYWPRYLLFTVPAWAGLAGLVLARLTRARAITMILVVALLGYPTQRLDRLPDGHSHDTEGAAAVIAANERPGDAIAYALHESPEPWEARDLVARYVPAGQRPLDLFAVRPQRTDGNLLATECADPGACLSLADPARLWVVRFQNRGDPLADLGQPKEDLLRAHFRLARIWLVRGLTVALYLSAAPTG